MKSGYVFVAGPAVAFAVGLGGSSVTATVGTVAVTVSVAPPSVTPLEMALMVKVPVPTLAATNPRSTVGDAPAPRLMIADEALLLANTHDVSGEEQVAVSCTVIAGLFAALTSVKLPYACAPALVVTGTDAVDGDMAALSTLIVELALAAVLPPMLACGVSDCTPGADAVTAR